MNKPVHLGLSVLELKKNINVWGLVWICKTKIWWKNKIALYGYRQFYYIKEPNYINKDIAEDVETRFDTSNNEVDRPYPKGENKKVIGLIKN